MVKQRQRTGQCRRVRAVKRGDAEENSVRLGRKHPAKRVPEMMHRRPAAIVAVQAGPAQLEQRTARGEKRGEVVFAGAVEAARALRPRRVDQPVDTDKIVTRRSGPVEQHQVPRHRVEPVRLAPRVVVDTRPAAAEFTHEDLVAQALGSRDIRVVPRETRLELGVCTRHPVARSLRSGRSIRGKTWDENHI